MKRLFLAGAALLLAAVSVLLLQPSPVDAVVWQPQPAPAAVGALAPNARLADVQRFGTGIGHGPEATAIDAEGRIVTGYLDGRIVRFSADLVQHEVLATTGGRPLGLAFAADGGLLIADAVRGLLRLETDGRLRVLADRVEGRAIHFADDVAVAGDTVLVSEASTRFDLHHHVLDVFEHRPNGRLLSVDPATGVARVLADQLYFANGLALGPDGMFVLVCETSAYRISRYWLKGPNAGRRDVFADNLPGFPDNITFNGRDRYWLALVKPRDPLLDGLAGWPSVRRLIARLPPALLERFTYSPIRHGLALALDLDGRIVSRLEDRGLDAYGPVTSVREQGRWLIFGSLRASSLARLPLAAARAN